MAPLNENKILYESPMRQNNTSSVRWREKCPPDELWFGGIVFIIISWCETFCDTPSTSRHFTLGVHIIPHRSWETELYVILIIIPHTTSSLRCTLRDGRHTCHRSSACYIMLVPHIRHVHIRRTGRLCRWWLTMHEIRSETEIEGSCVRAERQRKRGR